MFGRKNRRRNYPQSPPQVMSYFHPVPLNQGGQYQKVENRQFNPYFANQNLNYNFMNPPIPFPNGGPNPFQWDMNGSPQSAGGYPLTQGEEQQTYPVESILQNPLQPKQQQGLGGAGNTYMANPYPYMHPYPKHNFPNRPPSVMNSIMNSFKTQDGSLDFNKMMDTAGQMMNAFTQVSGLVKGIGGFFKV